MYKTFQTMAVLLAILICSCQKEESPLTGQVENHPTQPVLGGNMVLGRKLENPYSVENMRKAFALLSPQAKSGIGQDAEEVIQTTHYYIKFKPQNEQELDLLKCDSNLILYPYPLDYEILVYGEYHDPEVPASQPTYQYASVVVGHPLPTEVAWEKLADLYIPDEYGDEEETQILTRSGSPIPEAFIDALVDKSLELTGNDEPYVETRARAKWRPAGKITYLSDSLGIIGMEGIKVQARRWFTTHTGFVDAKGNYSCDGRFKRDANYRFSLERYEFHVKGDGIKTDFDGPKKKGDWNYHFSSKVRTEFFAATVFRAAYHYYYKNIGGLRRPPENSFWKSQMKLKVHNEKNRNNGAFSSARRFMGLGSQIKLYNPQNPEIQWYATTIHELAHAAHWRMVVKEPNTNRVSDYHKADDKMVESWAPGVQWYLTKMVYPNYKGRKPSGNYTNVVIDLIDSEDEDNTNYGKNKFNGDKVSGYTITQIEQALIGCNSWNKWKNNIKKYNNKTKQYVDELFEAW